MVIIAAAQTQWKGPWILGPVLSLGRNSYEVYLLHMFVVFTLLNLFVSIGKPMAVVPIVLLDSDSDLRRWSVLPPRGSTPTQ